VIGKGRRRVYRSVAVAPSADGFTVTLDGRTVHTPQRRPMAMPSAALAEAIAAEWAAQGETVDPGTMPLTRLAGSAIDIVAANRSEIVARTAAYAEADLLCYRADEPEALVERQSSAWQPLVEWATGRYAAPLRVTTGVIAVEQPAAALEALRSAVETHDDMRLTALAAAAAVSGSLILALAVSDRRIGAEEAWSLSQLDESWQIERWGSDPEAERRRAALKADLAAAARFLALLAV
jgi:chaperone required for assembly of F1-ATPase